MQEFFKTHIRISLDQLNTRNKEKLFINTCLKVQQRFVVDNTNPTREERKRYVDLAKAKKFKVICYYFKARPEETIPRNLKRTGKEKIPEVGIRGTYKRLEIPTPEEGFDELYYVELKDTGFTVTNSSGYSK